MHTGDVIRKMRKLNNMTQEDLGNLLGVKKAAVQKYEKGEIVNLKLDTIKKLCDIFQISAEDLIFPEAKALDEKFNADKIKKEIDVLETIEHIYGKSYVDLLICFQQLNDLGQHRILEIIDDMTNLTKYVE